MMVKHKRIGIIGAGNMGSALANGIRKVGVATADEIIVSDTDEAKLSKLAQSGVRTTNSNADLALASDAIIIAVKPNDVEPMLSAISSELAGKLVISIAAGLPTSRISAVAPQARVIRVMPNMPALVGAGAAGYCMGNGATEDDAVLVKQLLTAVGTCDRVEENDMDAVTGLSGSGPAFFYQAIAGMAEEGARQGLDADVALKLAAQTAIGAGKMVLETGKAPQDLTTMVASPGGTTIEGLKALAERKAKDAFSEAVKASTEKSRMLGAKK